MEQRPISCCVHTRLSLSFLNQAGRPRTPVNMLNLITSAILFTYNIKKKSTVEDTSEARSHDVKQKFGLLDRDRIIHFLSLELKPEKKMPFKIF